MPRQFPTDLTPYSEAENLRREVLKDTINYFETEGRLAFCHDQAQSNHKRWAEQAQNNQVITRTVSVIQGDWGEVTAACSKRTGAIYAVLNMANAYVPGGGYFEGMPAQEENMFRRTDCHFSILNTHFQKTQYGDRYTPEMTQLINAVHGRVYLHTTKPRVCIKAKEESNGRGYQMLDKEDFFLFHELRAAADDLRNGPNTLEFNEASMRNKIAGLLDTLVEAKIRHVVLSAFGCGAFKNPPDKVAQLFKEELEKRPGVFDEVVFAVYHAGYGQNNYPAFHRVLDGLSLAPKAAEPAPNPAEPAPNPVRTTEAPRNVNDSNTLNTRRPISVNVSPYCMETYPCRHKIEISYDDGSKEEKQLNGVEIWVNYKNYLNDQDRNHFSDYEDFLNTQQRTGQTVFNQVPNPNQGPQTHSKNTKIGFKVLAGFMIAIGALAVALAFVLLGAAFANPIGITVAAIGGALAASGIGFFAANAIKEFKEKPPQPAPNTTEPAISVNSYAC